jgi:hypothetical protein
MRVVVRVTFVVLCCLLAAPAIASAEVKPAPTQVALVEADAESIQAELRSPAQNCVSFRKIRLTERGSSVVFHTTTSDRGGHFAIELDDIPTGVAAIRIKVAPKQLARRLCEHQNAGLTFDGGTLSGGAGGGAFRGVLNSSVAACEPGRMISLYETSSDPVFVGWNLTDASGAWTIAAAGGTYQAHAEPALKGAGNAFTYCRLLVSFAWTYEEPPEESP